MSTYTLNNSATDIDSALQKVVSADTTPRDISPLMVTSGGVKAYVDTQDTALETSISTIQSELDTLVVSVSTSGISTTSSSAVQFTTPNFVTGVQDAAHNLKRQSTSEMRAPTGGVSMLSVNATLKDRDKDTNDNFTLNLLINDVLVARTTTPNQSDGNTTYANLCYSSYVLPNSKIKMSISRLSSASGGSIDTGNMTCVNYQ